jgi:hypothetical protein
MLTDIGGAAKSLSYIYRFLPLRAFSSAVRPFGDDQTGPKMTGILNFQLVPHPKPEIKQQSNKGAK